MAWLAVCFAGCMPPSWGAAALLHPSKKLAMVTPKRAFEELEFEGEGVRLKAWRFRAQGERRGAIIHLHGVADNRGSSLSVAERFVPRGYDVIAYDSRAHGQSQGAACTYGFYEKQDLRRVIAQAGPAPVILFGFSLGAAVALQTAAADERVAAVIAVAPFSDLHTVVKERAPFFASRGNIRNAVALAEQEGSFRFDEVSPVAAATKIVAPVLMIHGDRDDETPRDHSDRIFSALRGPKRLIVVADHGHKDVLTGDVWKQIEVWMSEVLPGAGLRKARARTSDHDPLLERTNNAAPCPNATDLPGVARSFVPAHRRCEGRGGDLRAGARCGCRSAGQAGRFDESRGRQHGGTRALGGRECRGRA